jgi:hypothetical protein
MASPLVRSRLIAPILFLALALLVSCGDPAPDRDDIAIIVTVQGLFPDVNSIDVSAVFNGAPAKNNQLIQKTLGQFVVYLPRSSSGTLSLAATALALDQCKIGVGQAVLQVQPNPPFVYELTLPLAQAAGKTCTITVEKSGQGSVVSTPPGLSCDTQTSCSADFPAGTQVTLAATVSPRSLGVTWSGACTGSGACVLTASSRQTVTATFPARSCTPDSWCWYNALPQGNFLLGIWGTAANDIWAVGYGGTFLHYDGSSWQVVPSDATNDLFSVRGSSPSEIWAVGRGGALWHYNGTSWSESGQSRTLTTVNLNALWSSAANDYFAVGRFGNILHFDGTSWTRTTSGTEDLTGVFGFAANDVWAIGPNGTLLHYNGTAWQASPQSGVLTTEFLTSIWGSAANDIYVSGGNNVLLHYDGSTWSMVTLATPSMNIDVLWGSGPRDVFAAGSIPEQIIHYDGTSWSVISQTLFKNGTFPTGIWGSGPNNVWIVGALELGLYDGTKVTNLSSTVTANVLQAVFGTSASDIWAVGQSGTLTRWNGSSWSLSSQSGSFSSFLYGLWGASASNLWAVGTDGTILNWNSVNWSSRTVGAQHLYAVWGANAADSWAVGQTNRILHWDNINWTASPQSGTFGARDLFGVWGSSPGDVWAVGTGGLIVHYNGTAWSQAVAPGTLTPYALTSVWGANGSDVWAVGDGGTILHCNGTVWSKSAQSNDITLLPALQLLRGVWGSGPNDIWAVGAKGTTLHYDGAIWSVKQSGAPSYTLNSAWGPPGPSGDVWAVGEGGSILRNQK